MNFERLFEECKINGENWTPYENHIFDKAVISGTRVICHGFESEKEMVMVSKSPEMLKALIERNSFHCRTCNHVSSGGDCSGCRGQDEIELIESATGKTWKEIKDILEGGDEKS